MKLRRLAIITIALIWGVWAFAEELKSKHQDNAILSLVLQRSYKDGGYTVIAPQTTLSHIDPNDPNEVEQTKKYIREKIKIDGYDIGRLVDSLFERNKKPVRLSLKSSPNEGYLIDSDRKYDKYFEKDGGGWEKWYQENPKAHGWTHVSLPAYDKENSIVLVYTGTQSHWLEGVGYVVAYRYEDGKLKELGRVMVWIS